MQSKVTGKTKLILIKQPLQPHRVQFTCESEALADEAINTS